jgi:hypothetical protein
VFSKLFIVRNRYKLYSSATAELLEIRKTTTEHRRINVEDGCAYPPQYDDVDYNPKVVTEPCENMQIYDNLFIQMNYI